MAQLKLCNRSPVSPRAAIVAQNSKGGSRERTNPHTAKSKPRTLSKLSVADASDMTGEIGYELEELLRAHFLRAGFFVVRGVPVSYGGEELTDVDLWLYDRPNGFARRI